MQNVVKYIYKIMLGVTQMKRLVRFFQVVATTIAMIAINVIVVLCGGYKSLECLRNGNIESMLVIAFFTALIVVFVALGYALIVETGIKRNR